MNRRSGPTEALSHLRQTQWFGVKVCKYFGICQCLAEGHLGGNSCSGGQQVVLSDCISWSTTGEIASIVLATFANSPSSSSYASRRDDVAEYRSEEHTSELK